MSKQDGRRPKVDPKRVAEEIEFLQSITNEDGYAQLLLDDLIKADDPAPELVAAVRSEELARRSFPALKYLLDQLSWQAQRLRKDDRQVPAIRRLQDRIVLERCLLDDVVRGMNAREGRLNTTPNPRGRAQRRLVEENLAGGDGLVPVRFLRAVEIGDAYYRRGGEARLTPDEAGRLIVDGKAWPAAGDTARGRFRTLLDEEVEKDAAAGRARKEQAKQGRRDERTGRGPKPRT